MGTNRKRATPCRKNIGTNTMQMHSSETKAGVTIWFAPSMIEVSTSLPCSRCQLMFSMVTVASSTRMPTASARPPRVMMLSVSPIADSITIAPSTESGIETAMMMVEPASQEQQDHDAGQQRGDDAFIGDAGNGAAYEQRLIADEPDLERLGQRGFDVDHLLLDAGDDIER